MLKQLFGGCPTSHENRFSIHQPELSTNLALHLKDIITEVKRDNKNLVILCIGSDRSTGDALGPLTGTKLRSIHHYPHVFGTLDTPVHATNLPETLNLIQQDFVAPYIIAIDACLGRLENVGYISVGRGSLKPGAAVNKNLPPVGDAYITGIVNVGGYLEHLVLQSTRLNLVVKMADAIAYGLAYGLQH